MPHPRILLAEDDPIQRTVGQRLLERLGARVETAPDGAQALERMRHAAYDLVFMDVLMPVMDGLAATRAIRDSGQHTLPIVAMTASGETAQQQECAAAGMNDLVRKPIDARHLAEALSRWLPGTSAPRTQAAAAQDLSGLPRDVPDLDVAGALARMLGRKSLYLDLLLRYVNTQREVPAQVRAALDTGEAASALRLAHTAKGLAATLGATRVASRAAALEEHLRPPQDPAQVEAAIEDLDAALEHLFAALSESLASLARGARAAGDKS